MSRLSPVAGGGAHADVIALAEQISVEELPEFIGALAHAQSLATLRLVGQGSQTNPQASAGLLTAEEVAALLRIFEANVYGVERQDSLKLRSLPGHPGSSSELPIIIRSSESHLRKLTGDSVNVHRAAFFHNRPSGLRRDFP